MSFQYRSFDSKQHLLETMESVLTDSFTEDTDRDYAVVLSGGNTPLSIYKSMTQKDIVPSPHLHLTLSDERCVPDDDPLNNASYVIPLLQSMHLPQEQFVRVKTNLTQEDAAADFEQALLQWQASHINIELAMLGIGPDGHTASLFTQQDIESSAGHLAIPVTRPKPPHRISTTPEFLCKAKRIIILAAGSEKHEIIQVLQQNPLSIPCGMALQNAQHAEVWQSLK